jgi:hypothetical protein
MSLTGTHAVFVSAHESALNDLIKAVVRTRPHLLAYGSPAFVPTSTVHESRMDAIDFPGTGGIEWRVEFVEPLLDLYDEDVALASPLMLEKGQFSLSTGVVLCVDCPSKGRDPRDLRKDRDRDREKELEQEREREKELEQEREREKELERERERERGKDERPHSKAENPICCKLDVQAVGELVNLYAGGERAIGFRLTQLELIDITPDDLESVLECLLGQILRAVLSQIRLPLSAIRAGAFTLTPTEGPLVEVDEVIARGDL